MAYAAENMISTDPIEGGIEITEEQYRQAIEGMLVGKVVTIEGGFAVIYPPSDEDADPKPQPEPTFEGFQNAKIAEINAAFDAAAAVLTEGYPEAERMTWPTQQAEALAWAADPEAPTPYLDGLAVARGITAEEMRQKTLDQTQLFMQASQQLVGTRQRLRDLVYEAQTPEDLDAISWPEATPT